MEKREMWNLIIARLENTITSGEDCKLEEWLKEEEHRKLFDEVSDLWKKAQQRSAAMLPVRNFIGNVWLIVWIYLHHIRNRVFIP